MRSSAGRAVTPCPYTRIVRNSLKTGDWSCKGSEDAQHPCSLFWPLQNKVSQVGWFSRSIYLCWTAQRLGIGWTRSPSLFSSLCSAPPLTHPPSAEPALCRMALTSMPSLPDGPGGPRGPGGPCGPTLWKDWGGEEKEKSVFASEETYRLNQKTMSESHSHPIPQGPPQHPGWTWKSSGPKQGSLENPFDWAHPQGSQHIYRVGNKTCLLGSKLVWLFRLQSSLPMGILYFGQGRKGKVHEK